MDFSIGKSMRYRIDEIRKRLATQRRERKGAVRPRMMQARIKIIKGGAGSNTNGLAANEIEKTVQQREREMANAVKSWVAEWETRNRALKMAAASLIRSLEDSSPGSSATVRSNQ